MDGEPSRQGEASCPLPASARGEMELVSELLSAAMRTLKA